MALQLYPIETAPKEDKKVVFLLVNGLLYIGVWIQKEEKWYVLRQTPNGGKDKRYMVVYEDEFVVEPTHWGVYRDWTTETAI